MTIFQINAELRYSIDPFIFDNNDCKLFRRIIINRHNFCLHNFFLTCAVILNPFNLFGNPKCFYNGDEGRCYGEVECLALAGNYGAFCPGLLGLCCLCMYNTTTSEHQHRIIKYIFSHFSFIFCFYYYFS